MHVNRQEDGARGRRAVILCSRAEAPTDGRPARRTVTAPPPGARTAARPPPPTSAVEGDEPRDGREALRRCTRGRRTPRRADQGVRAADPEPTRNPPGCERRCATFQDKGTLCLLRGSNESGRPGSNRRRPAWEASLALVGHGLFGGGSRNRIAQYVSWPRRRSKNSQRSILAACGLPKDGSPPHNEREWAMAKAMETRPRRRCLADAVSHVGRPASTLP